ncbi:MAG TPA: ester cyclase [Gammaproteobacteria bacterium]|jgi:predicted SnoaL-like aldol condensation-catalyzing enzyme|nr:ester cyclase [Gammaproteobacteria bacterium]
MRIRATALALLLAATVGYAAEPVVETRDQAALLTSSDPQLAANKKLVYDMWRTFINAYHVDEAGKFLAPEYHQHNPNAGTGLAGVIDYFKSLNLKATPVPDRITNKVVSIVAERDLVVVSLVSELKDKDGKPYTTTWFDMYRIANGKIVEHWDSALKGVVP